MIVSQFCLDRKIIRHYWVKSLFCLFRIGQESFHDNHLPTAVLLGNAFHLQAICSVGDLKLGYLSVRKKRCLDCFSFQMHFRTHKQWINRRNLRRGSFLPWNVCLKTKHECSYLLNVEVWKIQCHGIRYHLFSRLITTATTLTNTYCLKIVSLGEEKCIQPHACC